MNRTKESLWKNLLFFSLILFVVQFVLAQGKEASSENTVVSYGVGVTLTGKIATRLEYGAPGFGEDPKMDAKENIFLLVLNEPVDVCVDKTHASDTDSDNFEGIKEMQVVFTGKKMFSKKIVGKKIKMTGTLFQAFTGHHHTNVLIEVETVKKLK